MPLPPSASPGSLPPLPIPTLGRPGDAARLEPLTLAHVPALVAAARERATYHWTFVPDGEADMRAYVESALADHAVGRGVPFVTVDAEAGRVVGCTRFGNLEYWGPWAERPADVPRGVPDAVEIGWTWLAADAQRSAINTTAKRLMLAHAFETWRVQRVTLKTDERNARSRAAIERLGAKLDGLLRAHFPASDGIARTSAVYSIVQSEWPAVRDRLDGFLSACR